MAVNPKIQAFADNVKAFVARKDAAITGITGDIEHLNAKIEELQNTPGALTPEDEALLTEIETIADGVAAKLEALDAITAPPLEPPPTV